VFHFPVFLRGLYYGAPRRFENKELALEDLRGIAAEKSEPELKSGKQEYFENLVNHYVR